MTFEPWIENRGLNEHFEILLLPHEEGMQNVHAGANEGVTACFV